MSNCRILILLLSSFLVACTITGPADDGYENSNEWLDNGRLLSDKTREIYTSESQQNTKGANITELELDSYNQWQQAREQNSVEYQKFKQWQEFEDYQRWKDQQSQ